MPNNFVCAGEIKLSVLEPKEVVMPAFEYAVETTSLPDTSIFIAAAADANAKSLPTELTAPPEDPITFK